MFLIKLKINYTFKWMVLDGRKVTPLRINELNDENKKRELFCWKFEVKPTVPI